MSLPASSNSRDLDAFAGALHRTPNSMRRGANRDSRYCTQPPRLATAPFRASADVMSDLLSMGALQSVGISWTLLLLASRGAMERKSRPVSRGVPTPVDRPDPCAAIRGAVGGTSLSISEPSCQRPRIRPATAWRRDRQRPGHRTLMIEIRRCHHGASLHPALRPESIAMSTPVSIGIPEHVRGT
jgi:hypothetical protein